MIELVFPTLAFRKEVMPGITSISIDDQSIFRNFYVEPEANLMIVEFGTELRFEIIRNPFDIDLNEKKAIQLLYKEINGSINRNFSSKYEELITQLISLIKETFPDLNNSNVELCPELDRDKLYQALNIKYCVDESFLSNFVSYIKYKSYVTKHSIFITFNLKSFLTNYEYDALDDELSKEQIILIDLFSLINDRSNESKLIIDDDFCII